MSSSARRETHLNPPCEGGLPDLAVIVFVIVIVIVYDAHDARPIEPANAVSTAMRILRSLPQLMGELSPFVTSRYSNSIEGVGPPK